MTTPHTSGAADLPEALREVQIIQSWCEARCLPPPSAGDCVSLAVALAAGQAVAPVVDNKTAGHAMLWRQHCDKLDALVTYCPTCCQGFIAQKEMTRDQIIYECGKTAGRAALPAPPAMDGGEDAQRAGMSALKCWWAMHEAQWELCEESPADDVVILHFMGSGASTQVTAGQIRDALAARAAQKEGE